MKQQKTKIKTVSQSRHRLCSLVTEMLRSGHISSNSKKIEIQVIATQLQSDFPPMCIELYNSRGPHPEPTLEVVIPLYKWGN